MHGPGGYCLCVPIGGPAPWGHQPCFWEEKAGCLQVSEATLVPSAKFEGQKLYRAWTPGKVPQHGVGESAESQHLLPPLGLSERTQMGQTLFPWCRLSQMGQLPAKEFTRRQSGEGGRRPRGSDWDFRVSPYTSENGAAAGAVGYNRGWESLSSSLLFKTAS